MSPAQDFVEKKLDGYSFKGAQGSLRNANFARANLRGADFEGLDLSRADFSGAYLSGANFKGAALVGANFSGTRLGLSPRAAFWLVLLTLGVMLLAVGLAIGAGAPVAAGIYMYGKVGLVVSALVLAGALTLSVKLGVERGMLLSILFVPLAVAVIYLVNLFLPSSLAPRLAATLVAITMSAIIPVFVVILATTNVIILTGLRAVLGEGALVLFVIVALCLVLGIYGTVLVTAFFGLAPNQPVPAEAAKYLNLGYPALIGGLLGSLLVILVSAYLAKRVFEKDARHSLILSWAVSILSKYGTSFEGAELKDASFRGANLRNTNFKNAKNLLTCDWEESKDYYFANDFARLVLGEEKVD